MDISSTARTIESCSHDFGCDLLPQVFDAAAIGMALCHFDGRIVEGNAALARLLGYEPSELPGLNPWGLREEDSIPGSRFLDEISSGAREFFALEKSCCRKNSSRFQGRLTVSLARGHEASANLLVVLLEDATDRCRLEQQLRQAEKMELIGRLTAGVAHDFNNLLTGFLLYCDLLLSKLDPSDPLRPHVEEVREAGEQGSSLTQQLLTFARKQAPKARSTPVNQIVASTEHLLRRLIGEHIELLITLDPDAGAVFADPVQLRQVLLNLVLNARDALKAGGRIHVRTQAPPLPENSQASSTSRCSSLIVEDNGCGMTDEVRTHLFEPFFTTKRAGEGVGMGLATIHRIVAEMGGHVEVASAPAEGSRFQVFFPVVFPAQDRRANDCPSNNGRSDSDGINQSHEDAIASQSDSQGDFPC